MAIIDGEAAVLRMGNDDLARRFNDYCRTSSDWVWEVDKNGAFVFSSERCREFFSLAPSALVGTPLSSLGHFVNGKGQVDDHDLTEPFEKQLFQVKTPDGIAMTLEISSVPINDRTTAAFKGALGTGKDITRQYIAEQSLRAANEELEKKIVERTQSLMALNDQLRDEVKYHSVTKKQLSDSLGLFQAIAETSPVAMFISKQSDQTIQFANHRASDLLGIPSEALKGQKITDMFSDSGNRSVVRQLVEAEQSESDQQIRFRTESGAMRWGQLSSHQMEIDRTPVLLTAVMDISELKNADRQLAHTSRLATLGELSASIVHEINQPLSIMGMAIETALEACGDEDDIADPKTVRAKLSSLLQEQRRLVKVSNQMRGYSNKNQPDAEWFSVNQSCEYVINFLEHDFMRRDITFDIDLPEEKFIAFGVPTAFEQILMNVLTNARDAVEERSRSEAGDNYKMHISFEAALNEDATQALFRLNNNGDPISEEYLGKIFMPFVSTKSADSGTGLGLSICKRLITGMGGEITGANTKDGVAFSVMLPCKRIGDQPKEPRSINSQVADPTSLIQKLSMNADRSVRLLVVDDEPALRASMEQALRDEYFDVETAMNGKEALEKSRAQSFDVIISDIQMPEMDGLEFIKEYRASGAATPIIIVTSDPQLIRNRPDLLNQVSVLSKPVDFEGLVSLIKDYRMSLDARTDSVRN